MLASLTSAASSALVGGRINARPSRCARQVIASAPRTGRSSPVNESSPANSYFGKAPASSWCEAARMPSAMGRSKRPLSLGSSAGARLTVIRRAGNSKREFTSAAFLHFGVRKTDDGERGQAVSQMHLDGDFGRLQSRERTAVEHRERHRGLLFTQPRLEFGDARFQLGEFFAGAGEHLGLDLELCARRQVELGERGRKQRLQILLYILGGARGEEFADPRAQVIEYAGLWHRACIVDRV